MSFARLRLRELATAIGVARLCHQDRARHPRTQFKLVDLPEPESLEPAVDTYEFALQA